MFKWISRQDWTKLKVEWRMENEVEFLPVLSFKRLIRGPLLGFKDALFELGFELREWSYDVLSTHFDAAHLTIKCLCERVVKVCYKLTITGADGKEFTKSTNLMSARKDTKIFIPIEDCLERMKTTPFFTITGEIKYCYLEDNVYVHQRAPAVEEPKKIPEVPSSMNMLVNSILTDCVIKVGGQEIKAHRCVLSAHSNVFLAMFTQEHYKEKETGIVEMEDTDYPAVKAMLEYIYGGLTAGLSQDAEDVFMLADKYGIDSLKQQCVDALTLNINEKNFFRVVAIAYLCSCDDLLQLCVSYVATHKTLLTSREWQDFKKEHTGAALTLTEALVV